MKGLFGRHDEMAWGPRGPGRGRHHGGGRGEGGRGFGHGGLRLVLLKLIEQRPSHGYELIKEIEQRTGGHRAPSPGVVYPALSWLEDGGFITITTGEDSRKQASITEAGRAFLAEQATDVDRLMALLDAGGDAPGGEGHEYAPLFRAMDNLKGALRTRSLRPLSKTEIETIVDWIDDLARKIERS